MLQPRSANAPRGSRPLDPSPVGTSALLEIVARQPWLSSPASACEVTFVPGSEWPEAGALLQSGDEQAAQTGRALYEACLVALVGAGDLTVRPGAFFPRALYCFVRIRYEHESGARYEWTLPDRQTATIGIALRVWVSC